MNIGNDNLLLFKSKKIQAIYKPIAGATRGVAKGVQVLQHPPSSLSLVLEHKEVYLIL